MPVTDPIQKWAHLKPNQYCQLEVYPGGGHWWLNSAGMFHRVDENGVQDGPAVIWYDGTQAWFLNGKHHRLDGPAYIYLDGSQEWFLDDVPLTHQEWTQDIRVIEYHSKTQEGAESWLTRL